MQSPLMPVLNYMSYFDLGYLCKSVFVVAKVIMCGNWCLILCDNFRGKVNKPVFLKVKNQ